MAGITQRVGDKVLQDTAQKPAIAFDPDITRMHCKTKPGLFGHRGEFGLERIKHIRNPEITDGRLHGTRIKLADIQKLVKQFLNP